MKKYFVIKNENGRYLKTDGGWCNNLKGAAYGTEEQMRGMAEQKNNSPFSMTLEYLGEAESGWMAKQKAVKESRTDMKEDLIRKGGNRPNRITTKMMSFRLDIDNIEYLNTKANKGRYITELIQKDRENHTVNEGGQ